MEMKVYRTVKTVLHRITLRREYAYISTKGNLEDQKKAGHLIRLISSDDPAVNEYIYIGRPTFTRERFDQDECLTEIRKAFPSLDDCDVSFPDITELYRLSERKVLEINVGGDSVEEVNRKWIYECLQFDADERRYLNNDLVCVKIALSKIADRTVRQKDEEPDPVDAACFEVYDRMIAVFPKIDKIQSYGDACSIEYSIISDGYEYRYFITHFFSNHNWDYDPKNLLNICFMAGILPGSCSKETVSSSHPSKITARKTDGAEYLVETITMDNSLVRVKFRNGKTDEPSRSDVSQSRSYDNPVDFTLWVDLYYQEIRMA